MEKVVEKVVEIEVPVIIEKVVEIRAIREAPTPYGWWMGEGPHHNPPPLHHSGGWGPRPSPPPPSTRPSPVYRCADFQVNFFPCDPRRRDPQPPWWGESTPCRPSCAALVEIEKIVEVERRVEVPFDTIVEVERVVEVEKIVEIPIEVVKNAPGPPCAHVRN